MRLRHQRRCTLPAAPPASTRNWRKSIIRSLIDPRAHDKRSSLRAGTVGWTFGNYVVSNTSPETERRRGRERRTNSYFLLAVHPNMDVVHFSLSLSLSPARFCFRSRWNSSFPSIHRDITPRYCFPAKPGERLGQVRIGRRRLRSFFFLKIALISE